MSVVNVTLGDGKKLNLPLGRQGENEVTAVVFDFSAWATEFGSGTLSLSVQRHGDELPYAVPMTTSGTDATWTISDLDTAYKGTGEAQVKYTVGTKVKKSAVYKFTVNKSLGQNGEYPSPGQTWQEEIEDELADVKQDLEELQNDAGVTAELKSALLDIAENIAYINENGQTLYDNLYNALYPNASSITCVYTQTGTVYTTDTLDSLKDDLVVTAHYSDSTTKVLKPSDYTLTGTLTAGTSTVYVHYGDLTTSFTVTVTTRTLSSISAIYTQSGDVYVFTSLDSLKSDLVVTATYNDNTTAIVNDYTLSGTLAIGTSTVTVTYEDKTTTFTVTVVECAYHISDLTKVTGSIGNKDAATCGLMLFQKPNPNNFRRSFVQNEGETSIALSDTSDNVSSQTSNYYPIKVPVGANTFTINITPSTQYFQCLARQLNDGVYTTLSATGTAGGYQQGEIERTFVEPAGDNAYLCITSKYDSAGTSYPTEPTGLDVIFS